MVGKYWVLDIEISGILGTVYSVFFMTARVTSAAVEPALAGCYYLYG